MLPSSTAPVPCAVPKPEPEIVTWVPAGAHLVSTYSTSLADGRLAKAFRVDGMKRPRIAGLVLFYGAFDCETVLETGFPFVRMMLRSFLSRDPGLFKERARDASPIRHIKAAYPPSFICYALKDKLHTESEANTCRMNSATVLSRSRSCETIKTVPRYLRR